jgi:hypothetical protein
MTFLGIDWIKVNDAHNKWLKDHRLTQQDLFGVAVNSIPFAGTIISAAWTINYLLKHRKDQDLRVPVAELRAN